MMVLLIASIFKSIQSFSSRAAASLLSCSTFHIAIANSMQFLILFIWQAALACNACVWHMPHMSCPAPGAPPATPAAPVPAFQLHVVEFHEVFAALSDNSDISRTTST